MERVEHLKIPLEDIKLATNSFAQENLLGWGGFGPVYKGQLSGDGDGHGHPHPTKVAVKRLDSRSRQGDREFVTEIALLSSYKHNNLVALVGFCNDDQEKILVYELMVRGSLDKYLNNKDLTWTQRLQICLGAAHGLRYLHCAAGADHRILHRDIKSSNILLDEEWNAKISDFGLSRIGPSNQLATFLFSNACGTIGYVDPQYVKTGILTKESDVYSFGVMLFEVVCGRPAVVQNFDNEHRFLAPLAELLYEQERLDEIIHPDLTDQANPHSLKAFSKIAYHCLREKRAERPTINMVIQDLQFALDLQLGGINIIRVGPWGGSGGVCWSFLVERSHKLKKIAIEHKDWIFSLAFATEDLKGQLHRSRRFGGHGPEEDLEISEINFDPDEEIIGVSGTLDLTTGVYRNIPVVSSLCFVTSKNSHGPFGRTGRSLFSVPWEEGQFAGFYGSSGYYLDQLGVYFSLSQSTNFS